MRWMLILCAALLAACTHIKGVVLEDPGVGVGGGRRRHHDRRHADRARGQHRHRPRSDRGQGEVVPVGPQTGDAEEERSGSDVAGIAGQRSDLDVGIAVDATAFKTGGECGYVHAGR